MENHTQNNVANDKKRWYSPLKTFLKAFLRGDLNGHWNMLWPMLIVMLYPLPFSYMDAFKRWEVIQGLWGPGHWMHVFLLAFFTAYGFVFLVSFIRHTVTRRIVYGIGMTVLLLHCFIKLAFNSSTHSSPNIDIFSAILATNPNEAYEMTSSFVCPALVYAFLGLPIILLAYTLICHNLCHRKMPRFICIGGGIGFVLSGILCNYDEQHVIYQETGISYITDIVAAIGMWKDIDIRQTHPALSVNHEGQPPLIVWIIGESTTSHHCSLYGYDKETNPLLQQKVDSSACHVFTNVKSASTHTLESFKLMMSTYQKSSSDEKWNECDNLPEVAHLAGYRTCWMSNQSKNGLYDNLVGRYAELCDTNVFVGNKYVGTFRSTYDEELFPIVKGMLEQPTTRDFFIVNLYGCHESFYMRYPERFAHFWPNDYSDYPEHQRSTLCTYDNAVLYNDYVVSSLFDMIGGREAIAIYTPDHGMDIYESDPTYAAHAIVGNAKSCDLSRDIPCLIYMTPLFRERHPDVAERVAKSVHKSFDMEDAIYLMMDLMHCDFKDSPAVAQKSLLR